MAFSPRFAIATGTAPDTARAELPGLEILGDAFALAARLRRRDVWVQGHSGR